MRLRRLTGLEREKKKIEGEIQGVLALIEDLKLSWLAKRVSDQIIKDELDDDEEKKYGDPRRSEITIDTSDSYGEDLSLTKRWLLPWLNKVAYQTDERDIISQPT